MALFHRDVFLPKFPLPEGKFLLKYGTHSLNRSKEKDVPLPEILDTSLAQVVEVELDNRGVSKVLYRIPMNTRCDICIVVNPPNMFKQMFVKTVWVNVNGDVHKSLNRKRYVGG